MTETKHTPAPWLYENGKGIKACGNPLKVAGRTKVAVANRALIAAAPDMFAALEEARKGVHPQFVLNQIIDKALAKALGDS